MKRDCACKRANHRHGTWHAYATDDCRCDQCRAAWTLYTRDFRKRRHLARGPLTVDITGTRRRLQALAALGWGSRELTDHLGQTSRVNVEQWRHGPLTRVSLATHLRVAALYDKLWNQQPTRPCSRRTARWAQAQGWPPPMGLDDDRIDDPHYRPHMPTAGPWQYKPCGTNAAYQRHLRAGEKPCRACTAANRIRKADADARKKAA